MIPLALTKPKKFNPETIERFERLVSNVKSAVRTLEGGPRGDSQFARLELQPGFDQLQHHLDRALAWAEEMQLIIREELTP